VERHLRLTDNKTLKANLNQACGMFLRTFGTHVEMKVLELAILHCVPLATNRGLVSSWSVYVTASTKSRKSRSYTHLGGEHYKALSRFCP
jgi:hypothetical protein